MHGVSSKKIQRMLDTYERDVTGQSLFAMLPPLNCGKLQSQNQAFDTSVGSALDHSQKISGSAHSPSETAPIDDLFHFTLSPSDAGTDMMSAHSCDISSSGFALPVSGPHPVASSGYAISADDGIISCLLSEFTTSNLASQAVGSHPSDVPATASCKTLISSSSMFENAPESVCFDSVGTGSSATRAMENASLPVCTLSLSDGHDVVLLTENSTLSSKLRCTSSSDMATVTSPLSAATVVTADINGSDEKLADNSSVANGGMHADVMQNLAKLSASKMSRLIYDSSLADEAVGIVTDDAQSMSEAASSTSNTEDTNLHSFAELECGSSSDLVPADLCLGCDHLRAADASTPNTSLYVVDSQPSSKTDTFCDMNSACGQAETLKSDLPAAEHSTIEHLAHITVDKTSDCIISRVASKKNDDKYPEFTLRIDAREKDAETEASSTEQSIDKDGTSELLCEIEMADSVFEEKSLYNVPVAGSVVIQSVAQSRENDKLIETEARVENLEIDNAQRVAELKYWGQIDTSKRLNSAQTQAEVEMQSEFVGTVTSSPPVAEQHIRGTAPKPQRRSLRSCQKKQASSLMDRIVAGKQWLSECEPCGNPTGNPFTLSEHSLVDEAASQSDVGQCTVEQRSLSDKCRSVLTQTEPHDFITLTKATNSEEFLGMTDYGAVVETFPRVISSHVTDSHTLPNVPVCLMLHKSCSTANETENVTENSSQLDLLASCFPTISLGDLQELLTNCGNDIIVVADLLLEFGYEYNEPQEDIAVLSSSSSHSVSTQSSPDRSAAARNSPARTKETKGSKKNTSALYRLYRDSLISKGIAAESVKIQTPCELQVPVNIPTSGLYLCVLFCVIL